jgi:hypothetical protein
MKVALLLATLLCASSLVLAQVNGDRSSPTRCPAGSSGCTIENAPEKIKERVDEGARKVIGNTNPDGRAKEVRETIKDCGTCGREALDDAMDKIFHKDGK